MIRKFVAVVALLAAVAFGRGLAWSQGETGSISGIVTDKTGAVVPGANVTAKGVATGVERATKAGDNGQYVISGLEPGFYDVTVTSGSFSPSTTRGEVTVGGKLTINVELALSGVTTVVEVVGVGGTVVNTQSQELSQLVDSTQMSQLPSLNRNPYDFVSLSGNVSNADNTSNGGAPNPNFTTGQSFTGRGVGYQINGQRSTGTEILLDGVENVSIFTDSTGQPVPADSIQEFSIVTNNFGAEYGRASGGVVNVNSKPGTNQYHGSAYEYNRLSAYTTNTFGNTIEDVPEGSYVRNQFGYLIGGPIIKNKFFGFFAQEFTRVRSNSGQINDILDPAFIALLPSNVQSFFTQFGTGALPASGQVVTAGQLAANFGQPFPLINGVTPVPASTPVFDTVKFRAPFDAGGGVPQNTNNILARFDYNFSDQTQMFFRYARYNETDFPGSVSYGAYPQYNTGATNADDSFLISLTHVFNPNVVSTSKVSYTRFNDNTSFDTALVATPNMYLQTASYAQVTDPVTSNVIQLPGLQNTALGSGGVPVGGPQNTNQFAEDVAWSKGRHTMHFGGEYTYIQLNYAYNAYGQSQEVMGSTLFPALSNLVNAGGVIDPATGAFASPMLQFQARVNAEGALPCATTIYGDSILTPACTVAPPLPLANYARSYRYHDWAVYAGDSFKITRKLVLNYALRYEHYGTQANNHQDLDSNYYPAPGGIAPLSIRNGQVDITTQSPVGKFWAPRWGTLAPRVGFAYDLTGDGKTALRGGFGISYERNFGNITYNASFNPPASAVLSDICTANASGVITTCPNFVTNNNAGPLGLPGPPTALTPVELRDNNAYFQVAQTQFWSLALDRQLLPGAILGVSYSGAHAVHLYDLNNINLLGAGQFYLGDPLVTTQAPAGGVQCPYTDPGDPTGNTNACYTRLNSQYAAINLRGNFGSSSYNGLNLKFQANNLHNTGLTLVANYTWSHSLDDLSSTFSESLEAGSLGYTSFYHPLLDWGSSDFDVRNRFVLSPVWQTPWYNTGKGFLTQALGGWTVSGIFTTRSGVPFSVYDVSYILNAGYISPRLTPATPITQYQTGTPVLQPNSGNTFFALNVPPPANLGPNDPTLGVSDFGPFPADMSLRNKFRGPGAWNIDAAIGKTFRLTERFHLDFRAEAFNALNHANYYVNPDFNYYSGPTTTGLSIVEEKGGLGTSALGGNHDERRFFQFSLRLSF